MCCKNATDAFSESKRQKQHPAQTAHLRDQLCACTDSVNKGLSTTCEDVYQSLIECRSKNRWSKCADIKKELEKCAIKAKLGELA